MERAPWGQRWEWRIVASANGREGSGYVQESAVDYSIGEPWLMAGSRFMVHEPCGPNCLIVGMPFARLPLAKTALSQVSPKSNSGQIG